MVDVPTRARNRPAVRARPGRTAVPEAEGVEDPYAAWYAGGDPEAPEAPDTTALEVVPPAAPAARSTLTRSRAHRRARPVDPAAPADLPADAGYAGWYGEAEPGSPADSRITATGQSRPIVTRPTDGSADDASADPVTGEMPVIAADDPTGPLRVVPAEHTGSHPAPAGTGRHPAVERSGMPRPAAGAEHTGGYPAPAGTGRHPAVERSGSPRPPAGTGRHPAVAHTGNRSAVAGTGARPAVEHTATGGTGAHPLFDGTGSQAAAAPAVERTGGQFRPAATEITGPQPSVTAAEPPRSPGRAGVEGTGSYRHGAAAPERARAAAPAWTAYLNDAPTGPMPVIQDESFAPPSGTVTAPVEVVTAPPAPPRRSRTSPPPLRPRHARWRPRRGRWRRRTRRRGVRAGTGARPSRRSRDSACCGWRWSSPCSRCSVPRRARSPQTRRSR